VLESREQIGGVWSTNNYSGLRLHAAGSAYRCFSLAPQWTRNHSPQAWYRPARDEIVDYILEMAEHENVTIRTACAYRSHHRRDSHIAVECGDGSRLMARALIFSTGFSITTCGTPSLPFSASELCPKRCPAVVHSSVFNDQTVVRARKSKRLVMLGSGKAAIDILGQLSGAENVIWAHRGHTAFLPRDTFRKQVSSDGREFERAV